MTNESHGTLEVMRGYRLGERFHFSAVRGVFWHQISYSQDSAIEVLHYA